MSGKLRYEIEIGDVGTSIYALKRLQKAVFDVGDTGKKSFKQLELEQRGIVAQLSGQKVFHMPSDDDLRAQSQKMLSRLGTIPSVQPTPSSGGGINFSKLIGGAIAGLFSPYIGARMISGSGIFGGGGGSGNGSASAGLFGAGGAGGFAASFVALKVVTDGLKIAFHELIKTSREVSDLYVKATTLGVSSGNLFQVREAFKNIGLSSNAASKFSVLGQGGLTAQEQVQFRRLGPDFAAAMKDASIDSELVARHSREAFDSEVQINRVSREWRTAWVSLVQNLTPVVKRLADLLQSSNRENLEGQKAAFGADYARQKGLSRPDSIETYQKLRNDPAFLKAWQDKIAPAGGGFPFGGGNQSNISGLEKMGLIVGYGGSGQDYAKQTATNTKETAKATNKMAQLFTKMNGGGASPMSYYMTAGINAY